MSASPPSTPRETAGLLREALASWIPRGADVAILDVPVHRNPGDLFIYAVSAWLLEQRGCRVIHRAGVRDYHAPAARRIVHRDAVVVGLGGGNFGDLYAPYQALRERVLEDFADNRVVVLPQSIHFSRREALDASVARMRRHPDLRIAVRDAASAALARTITPHVQLLPDVVDAAGAAVLEARGARGAPAHGSGTLCLRRRDAERRAQRAAHDGCVAERDWSDLLPGIRARLAVAALLMPMTPESARSRVHAWWQACAFTSLARAVEQVRRFERVVTDRLHAAIVARLAGRPVTLVDNSYGKLSAYYDAWWADDPGVTLERSSAREGDGSATWPGTIS